MLLNRHGTKAQLKTDNHSQLIDNIISYHDCGTNGGNVLQENVHCQTNGQLLRFLNKDGGSLDNSRPLSLTLFKTFATWLFPLASFVRSNGKFKRYILYTMYIWKESPQKGKTCIVEMVETLCFKEALFICDQKLNHLLT